MPGDVLLPSHNIVARTEHCVQRTLPVRTVFFGDIIVPWTQGGGGGSSPWHPFFGDLLRCEPSSQICLSSRPQSPDTCH